MHEVFSAKRQHVRQRELMAFGCTTQSSVFNKGQTAMKDGIGAILTLLDEVKGHLNSSRLADRRMAAEKLRQLADVASTLAVTIEVEKR